MKTIQHILKVFIYLFCILSVKTGFTQNVGISATSGFVPDASAGLDVNYTNKGLLVPRVALTATSAAGPITSPAISLLVYNTATAGTSPTNVVPGYYYWNGTAWTALSTGTQTANPSWSLIGNAGTTAGTNFIGTTDAVDFVFKTNNAERARFTSAGNFGIGSTAFNGTNPEKLLVDAGASSFNVISGKGNLNNYLQLNIQNINAGTIASSDVVATADNGSESANYVDMGVNSSANTAAFFGAANDSYLYNAGGSIGGNFFIGTSTAGKSLGFLTGGGATTNERMRIDGNGNIGIGTITPATKLHVFGANPLTLSGVVTGTSTTADSLLTITSGLVRKLPMSTFASPSNSWSTLGNAGTTAGTNFIGTTDAQDMVFKANNLERMRIVNGTSATTGTTGDITIGDVNSGTLRSAKELVLRQDGDVYGQSTLRLRNRAGQNGAVFETTGGSANLVDFIFNTGAVASPISSNIRFETRSGNMKVTGNTTEWQFGQPDVVNGGPTLVVGAAGTGSNSSFLIGKVGIGNNAPTEKLDVTGNLKFSGALMPNNNPGTAGYFLQSAGSGTAPVWVNSAPNAAWGLTGNAGTTASTNFIGTTDAIDFVVKTNNTEKMRVSSAGDVSIGGTAFNTSNPEQLLVDAGTTSSTNVISGKGSINSFLQLNIQNLSTGTSASTDVVATADNGTDAVNYVDMGINGSGNKTTFNFGSANDAYLYNVGGSVGGNFYIGTSTSAKFLAFLTGGTAASNERMRIDGSGNVGIGSTTPGQKLEVNGNIYVSGGSLYSKSSVVTDFGATNTGTVTPGLQLGGTGSGEGISSKRTTGTNQYGLDFYTASANRMAITQAGSVGIGTTTPQATLDIAGTVNVGVGGTTLNNIMRGSFTITNSTAITNGDKQTSTVAITGITTGANIIINPTAALPGAIAIASVRVSSAGNITIAFVNTSSTSLAVGTVTFNYTIIQ